VAFGEISIGRAVYYFVVLAACALWLCLATTLWLRIAIGAIGFIHLLAFLFSGSWAVFFRGRRVIRPPDKRNSTPSNGG
jgi:hypothetical protein